MSPHQAIPLLSVRLWPIRPGLSKPDLWYSHYWLFGDIQTSQLPSAFPMCYADATFSFGDTLCFWDCMVRFPRTAQASRLVGQHHVIIVASRQCCRSHLLYLFFRLHRAAPVLTQRHKCTSLLGRLVIGHLEDFVSLALVFCVDRWYARTRSSW
jgi:hypothetical protein